MHLLSSTDFFQKILSGILSVSNSLNPDQDRCSENVGPDLGPNRLQRLSVDDKSHRWHGKNRIAPLKLTIKICLEGDSLRLLLIIIHGDEPDTSFHILG